MHELYKAGRKHMGPTAQVRQLDENKQSEINRPMMQKQDVPKLDHNLRPGERLVARQRRKSVHSWRIQLSIEPKDSRQAGHLHGYGTCFPSFLEWRYPNAWPLDVSSNIRSISAEIYSTLSILVVRSPTIMSNTRPTQAALGRLFGFVFQQASRSIQIISDIAWQLGLLYWSFSLDSVTILSKMAQSCISGKGSSFVRTYHHDYLSTAMHRTYIMAHL